MTCRQCQGIETVFDKEHAVKQLARYRKKGPNWATRLLLDGLRAEGVEGMTLLDVGGGVGTIQHELLPSGVRSAVSVEASAAYIEAARDEAERRGHAGRITHRHGSFVDLAAEIPQADIVTLDRVICCYHDMQGLVDLSAARARKLYGVVYPRDAWWMRIGILVLNLSFRLQRIPFRLFLHPTREVEAVVSRHGLRRRFYRRRLGWQVAVYARDG
jgi:magnesium-protoporphyrin O-methyltransferase